MADNSGATPHQFEHYFDAGAEGASRPHFAVGQPSTATPAETKSRETTAAEPACDSPANDAAALSMVRDVELDVKIELGRAEMVLEDVLKLRSGSVVPLDKLAGDLVDITINGRLMARGEVVVIDDHFCVRVVELVAAADAA